MCDDRAEGIEIVNNWQVTSASFKIALIGVDGNLVDGTLHQFSILRDLLRKTKTGDNV